MFASTSSDGRKSVLVTAVPLPANHRCHLKELVAEAHELQAAFGEQQTQVLLNPTLDMFGKGLDGKAVWWFGGHGDMPLDGENVPAFCHADGTPEVVTLHALAETVRPHVVHGCLQLIVFTGCKTLALAKKLRELTGVPCAVGWQTLVEDRASRQWALGFATAIAAGNDPRSAFDAGCVAVTTVVEKTVPHVQRYELFVDPEDEELVHPITDDRTPPHLRGRLRKFETPAQRGRICAGTPVLLDDHAPVRADVPHEAPALDSARHVQRVGMYPRLVDAITSGEATVSVLVGD